ncbi:hypothetical protein PybrP1_010162 [[Pythium] brassicae (nom. inval.)]|nr:hypothetical protein PybrP1_010162 [[Pythium] brassicae (nom. inval.)]
MSGDKRAATDAEEQQSPKRQRAEEEEVEVDPATSAETRRLQAVLDKLAKVEEELEKDDDKLAKEILAIETKYNKAKRPAYEKRSKLLEEIPGFWKQAFSNHPLIGNFLEDKDDDIIEYLKALDIKLVDDLGSFRVELTFMENPYLNSTTLWKQITFSEDDEAEPVVTVSELAWKDTEFAKDAAERCPFFQSFFSLDSAQDVAEIIRDDLFKKPIQYYLQDEEDDMDEDGDGDEEEEDDDDGESADDAEE